MRIVAVSPSAILSGEEISICPKPRLSWVDALAVVRISPFGWREVSTFDSAMEFAGGVPVLEGGTLVTAPAAAVGLAGGLSVKVGLTDGALVAGGAVGALVGDGAQAETRIAKITDRSRPLILVMYSSLSGS
jgi:hypothetical protein